MAKKLSAIKILVILNGMQKPDINFLKDVKRVLDVDVDLF